MMRIVVTTIAGVVFCVFQSGCCCCRLPMFAGRPMVVNRPPIVIQQPPVVIEPPRDVGGPKDLAVPKDIGVLKDLVPPKDKLNKDGNPPVGGPMQAAVSAIEKLGERNRTARR